MNPLRLFLLFLSFAGALTSVLLFGHACTTAPASNVTPMVHRDPTPPPPSPDAVLQDFLADYDRFFSDSMALTQTPGAAVVIVKDGEVIFQRGYGVKVLGRPEPVDTHTVFRIGSLSKGFAGILTGMLVQDGLLSWDEPVQHRYPEFTLRDRSQAGRMQVQHILSHTTGLPYHAFTHLIEQGYDVPTIIKTRFPRTALYGKEGEVFNYQNVAFCAIEEVMRAAALKSYSQLLTEKIFQPAGMHHASCDFATMEQNQNKALPHFKFRGAWLPGPISPYYYNSVAAGGVNASIADMGEWLKLLLGHRPDLVADTTLDRVFQPVIKTDKGRRIFPQWIGKDEASYAMGWRVLQHGGETIVYHGGYVNGFRGEIALNRRDGIAICVLFNASTELGRACIPAFFERWAKRKEVVLAGKP